MTISSLYVPDEYNGNDVLVTFTFNWRILQKDDLVAELLTIATGAKVVQVLDTDYTIANDQVDTALGGNLVMTIAPATGERLILTRVTDRTQLVNIAEGGPFPAATITRVFDRLTMIVQELDYSATILLEALFESAEEDVTAAAVLHAVVFTAPFANTDYLVLEMTTNWATTAWWSAKLTTGFTINFSNPAPAGAKVVWRARI